MIMRGDPLRRLSGNDRGTTAVEFAPLIVMIAVGIMSLSFLMFSIGSMHYAVQAAARCKSAIPSVCTDSDTTVAYASTRYYGPLISPVFTYVAEACGNRVTATVTYTLDVGMFKQSVPISATSCFP
jgi:Flp pilus assembly pilin Flp